VKILAPRQLEAPWAEALRQAQQSCEPIFVPWRHHCDDRGWSLMNLLAGAMSAEGQLNFSVQYPGVVKAWHRHEHQTDCWVCVHGHVKAGVHRESDGSSWATVLGEMRPGVLMIPPPLWHGAATVGCVQASLLYYMTRAFDPARPDEHRRPWDGVPGFDWGVENR
jgi:dTDP-4-dehydrorhamnose 3,5-epimerase